MKLCALPKEGEEKFNELLSDRPDDSPVELMTTLRYDPRLKHLTRRVPIAMEDSDDDVFFLSKLHHRRLKYGAALLHWDAHISHTQMVTKMVEAVESNKHLPQRVRVSVDPTGAMNVVSMPVPERDNLFSGLGSSQKEGSIDPVYKVFISKERTPATVTNMIKTTDRSFYNRLREPLKENEECLLVGTNGEILEGTLTSVAFHRNNEWITPKLNNGGMVGTTRSLLLGLGFVKEGTILASEIVDGEPVLLSNGVNGVCAGYMSI